MRHTILLTALLVSSSLAPACTCIARDAETYRADTRTVLETKNGAIKRCYDTQLETDGELNGDVVINFIVEKKSGTILNAAVDTERSSAPAALGECIVKAVDGLVLEPEDQREGQATFTWRFKVNAPAA